MNKPLLYVSMLVWALSSCKKEETPLQQLPAATQEGKQTAGWLLNDRAWIPKPSSISIGEPIDGYWRKTRGGNSLSLSFRYFSKDEVWGTSFFPV